MTTSKYIDPNDVLEPLSLADALETIREDLELTKVDMAKKLGISKSHYRNIIKSLETVSIKRAGDWVKALGYPEMLSIQYAIQESLSSMVVCDIFSEISNELCYRNPSFF